eukprot:GHVP01042470.1.p1 GENE.GHVP01042470.1~~GHVP01042470.1.p1  ORF type:complete len:244 (+),score=48.58 GHVP01042470.1:418-1149(+)
MGRPSNQSAEKSKNGWWSYFAFKKKQKSSPALGERKNRGDMETVFADLKQVDSAALKPVTKKSEKPEVVPKKHEKMTKVHVVGRFEKDGRDWVVENYKNHPEVIEVKDHKMMESLHVRCCEGVIIQTERKMNQIIIDSCKDVTIRVETLVSSLEVIHCEKVKIVVQNLVPSIFVDSSDTISAYIPTSSKSTLFTTSKTSEFNIHSQSEEDPEEWSELPVPCQYTHTLISGNKIETKPADTFGV